MATGLPYHTQGIAGFQFRAWNFAGGRVPASISRHPDKFKCPACGSFSVTATPVGTRVVQGLLIGTKQFWLDIQMHGVP